MSMVRKREMIFDKKLIEDQAIFRHKSIPGYFVTERFIGLMRLNSIKGLDYLISGKAE